MKYDIIENCSPFYIRIQFTELPQIISKVQSMLDSAFNHTDYKAYVHSDMTTEVANEFISKFKFFNDYKFVDKRVAIFTTPPGSGCGIHKDGTLRKVSFNIPIQISDDKCVTRWYDDDPFVDATVTGLPYSRNVYRDYKTMQKIPCIKSLVANAEDMVVFNTDIYHSWDNTLSPNYRKILTLRLLDDSLSFDEVAKNILSKGNY